MPPVKPTGTGTCRRPTVGKLSYRQPIRLGHYGPQWHYSRIDVALVNENERRKGTRGESKAYSHRNRKHRVSSLKSMAWTRGRNA
jgi:hypothetical protein